MLQSYRSASTPTNHRRHKIKLAVILHAHVPLSVYSTARSCTSQRLFRALTTQPRVSCASKSLSLLGPHTGVHAYPSIRPDNLHTMVHLPPPPGCHVRPDQYCCGAAGCRSRPIRSMFVRRNSVGSGRKVKHARNFGTHQDHIPRPMGWCV